MLHGDVRRTGRAHGAAPERPVRSWTFHADGPIEAQIVASPDERTLYAATLGGTLWALEPDGEPRFHLSLGDRSYATPTVGPDGTIYAGRDGGALLAVRPDGTVAWRLETDGDADCAPLVTEGGLVIAAAGAQVYGVKPGGVLAFRFRTRRKVFTAPALVRSADEVDRVVFGSQDGRVYAIDLRGELVWEVDLGHDVDGGPVVGDDGAIYVGTDGDELVRIEPDGRVAWRRAVGGFVRGPLSLARNGDVLAGTYGPSARLLRVSPGGRVVRELGIRGRGSREQGVWGGALEDDRGTLVFGGQDGQVHAMDTSGALRWTLDAGADVDAPVTLLSDGTMLVATYAGDVLALRPVVADAK